MRGATSSAYADAASDAASEEEEAAAAAAAAAACRRNKVSRSGVGGPGPAPGGQIMPYSRSRYSRET